MLGKYIILILGFTWVSRKGKMLDNITASAISTGEVSSLNHEIFDDAMKFASSISISFLKRLCQLNTQVDITHTVR